MKNLIGIILIITSINCFAQFDRITIEQQENFNNLIDLIRNDQVIELSHRVSYPLKRPNPIPDIKTPEEFILYYPTLFDSVFKENIICLKADSTTRAYKYYWIGFSSVDGIWFTIEGNIYNIHHQSPNEIELLNILHREIENKIYSEIKGWEENILVWENDKFLIRVDRIEPFDYRYISWSKPKSISDKPDLVLFNGTQEYYGTEGGEGYNFENGEWVYKVRHQRMGPPEDPPGWYLELYQNGIEKAKYIMKVTK